MANTQTQSIKAEITNDLNGTSHLLRISKRWIYSFHEESYSDWKYEGDNTHIPAGYGFTMKGVSGTDPTVVDGRANNPGTAQRYDFRGKPSDEKIEIQVYKDKNILVGNPYPSALDLSLFLMENSGSGSFYSECLGTINRKNAITGIAYFWDSNENGTSHYLEDYVGGYGAFSPVDPCTTEIYEKPIFKKYGS